MQRAEENKEKDVEGEEAKADQMVPEADEPNSVAKHPKHSEQVAVPTYHGKSKMLISNIIHLTRGIWNFHIKTIMKLANESLKTPAAQSFLLC